MQLVYLWIFIFLSLPVFSQTDDLLYTTRDLPIKKGKIYAYTGHKCVTSGVEIISTHDSVFSLNNGIVKGLFDLDGEKTIVIKAEDGWFYTYSNLKNVTLKKGERVYIGTRLGNISKHENSGNSLIFIITNKKGCSLDEDGTVKKLKTLQGIPTRYSVL